MQEPSTHAIRCTCLISVVAEVGSVDEAAFRCVCSNDRFYSAKGSTM